MTAREFEQAYLGRQVKWSPDDGGVYEAVVVENRVLNDPYVKLQEIGYTSSDWARVEQLELIEERDNKPLPLPG
jgi:hypothetical protein